MDAEKAKAILEAETKAAIEDFRKEYLKQKMPAHKTLAPKWRALITLAGATLLMLAVFGAATHIPVSVVERADLPMTIVTTHTESGLDYTAVALICGFSGIIAGLWRNWVVTLLVLAGIVGVLALILAILFIESLNLFAGTPPMVALWFLMWLSLILALGRRQG